MNNFQIICENGDSWITSMNCNIQEARKYFVDTYKVYEDFATGAESKTRIISVEERTEL